MANPFNMYPNTTGSYVPPDGIHIGPTPGASGSGANIIYDTALNPPLRIPEADRLTRIEQQLSALIAITYQVKDQVEKLQILLEPGGEADA